MGFVSLYLAMQVLVPLRHWLYPGNVSWTEEGHRFSWHMKLRDKEAHLTMRVTEPRTGTTWPVDFSRDLTPKQIDEMSTRPDMIWQYARFLRSKLEAEGVAHPIVTADAQVSLNGRPYAPMIDPNVNLATTHYSLFSHATWITPLREPLPTPSTKSHPPRLSTGQSYVKTG